MMGEIAEMMLDGTMCQSCGEWLHGGEDGPGIPGFCFSCQPDALLNEGPPSRKPFVCPDCNRRFRKEVGLKDHRRDAHPPAHTETAGQS